MHTVDNIVIYGVHTARIRRGQGEAPMTACTVRHAAADIRLLLPSRPKHFSLFASEIYAEHYLAMLVLCPRLGRQDQQLL
jgi:hypothetical protein